MKFTSRKQKSIVTLRGIILFLLIVAGVIVLVSAVGNSSNLSIELQRELYPVEYSKFVDKYCKEYDVDKYLVYSVIYNESRFKTDAESDIGARGLMQLTESTFDWVAYKLDDNKTDFDDMYDAETSIKYGVFLLSYLTKEFGNTRTILCAYHAGRSCVIDWLNTPAYSSDGITVTNIPYDDTDYYVTKVIDTIDIYKTLYNEEDI